MMISPLSNQASEMNANVVDLKNDDDLTRYAAKVAASGGKDMPKTNNKKKSKSSTNASDDDKKGQQKTMEIKTRRIVIGELVYNYYYPKLESTIHLSISIFIGLILRWLFGLVRSLRLSSMGGSGSGGGPCCSPYRGTDDEGTRQSGSFERLLACVLIKQEGDNGGVFILSMLALLLVLSVLKLAWHVSNDSPSKNGDDDELDEEEDDETDVPNKEYEIKSFDPMKVKRFMVGLGTSLFSLWLFYTPALLRVLGLEALTEAAEEWGARVLLFGNLLGVTSLLPETTVDTLDLPSNQLEILMNTFLILLALTCGYILSGMMVPINETARNAAHILSPSPTIKGKEKMNPNEMMDLINTRMMLIIQAMAPFMIMCTYLSASRFAEMTKIPTHGGGEGMKKSFSKQYLTNSGLFVRVALSWCFFFACSYTFRSLLQSYFDQAASVASAMATSVSSSNEASVRRGSRDKRSAEPPKKVDPFNERYKNIVLTACRIGVFPVFILAMLAVAHLRGGDGSTHPGVGHISLPKDAPRPSLLPVKGLLPPYSNQYMSWIANQNKEQAQAGDELLYSAALSQSYWDQTPMRNSVHKQVASWLGRKRVCYPPEVRSVKAMGRHVNFLLDSADSNVDSEGSILTINALTGRELLEMAPPVRMTVVDMILGRKPEEESCKEGEDEPNSSNGECKALSEQNVQQYQTYSEMTTSLLSHNFLTPTIVFPIIDTLAFLSSVWWTYWYSIKMAVYYISLRRLASHSIIS